MSLEPRANSYSGLPAKTMPLALRHLPYLKKNVLGTIPLLEYGPNTKMTESVAICQFLAAKAGPTPLVVEPTEEDYGSFLNWMVHSEATLTFPLTVVLRYTLQEKGVADAAALGYAKWYVARLRMLNAALEDGREYLCADRFTLADVCVTYALWFATTLKMGGEPISARFKPQTAAYLERMTARPGWAAARRAEDLSAAEFPGRSASSL